MPLSNLPLKPGATLNLDDEAGRRAAERARLEDRLARARRRLDQSALILVEQRQRAELAEEAGLRVAEAKSLLKIFEGSHRQFALDRNKAYALLAAFDDGDPPTSSS